MDLRNLLSGHYSRGGFLRLSGSLVLPLTALAVGLFLFLAYFPGLLHQDSQTRWAWAFTAVTGGQGLQASDYWHPFMTTAYYTVLRLGLPVWTIHLLQIPAFLTGYVLLAQSILRHPLQRAMAAVILLLPVTWHYAALQAADTWLVIGLLWLLWGFIRAMQLALKDTSPKPSGYLLPAMAILLGCFFLFTARYNALPVILPLLLLPFMVGLPLKASLAMVILLLTGFTAAVKFEGPFELTPAHTRQMLMAVDIVGIWQELHLEHPGAAPSFAAEVEDWDRLFAAYDPHNHDSLVWKDPFFRRPNIARLQADIETDFLNYALHWPGAFWKVKLRTFANPFGFPEPIGPWFFSPSPDIYLDMMGIPQLTNRPLSLPMAVRAEQVLDTFFGTVATAFRPYLWWLAWTCLLAWRLMQRRLDGVDGIIFLIAAAYFVTFFPFSNGFLLRYFFPVWILFVLGAVRLLHRPLKYEHC